MKREFPSFFPQDCPPTEARPAVENFFRLVRTDPPGDNDFRSHVENDKRRRYPDMCKASGLSVFTKLEDIQKLKRRIAALRERKVAKGKADAEDGMVLYTPTKEEDSHHTWWLFEGVTVAKNFAVVVEDDGENAK